MLTDPELTQAVSKILLRSERVGSVDELRETFVDTGVLPQLDNDNNQIVYGRRGTGKSHVLRILGATAGDRTGTKDVYVDLRYLGSTQQATDPGRPFPQRCATLFRDLLLAVYEALLEVATDPERRRGGSAIDKVEDFGSTITRLASSTTKRHVARREAATGSRSGSGELSLGPKPGVSVTLTSSAGLDDSVSENYTEVFEDSLVFAEVRRSCEAAIRDCGLDHLLVLIDEWTVLPTDIQPFFAEFIKRTFLPSRSVTIKVGSLEYRSKFTLLGSNNFIVGFEVGGDVSANLDLDDYYVYDRNPTGVTEIFQEILFRHITAELPAPYRATRAFTSSSEEMRKALFTETATFVELVRAAEGVVRDFISIFNRAYFLSQRSGRRNIDIKTVREAARQWYETDKSINLSADQQTVLHRIVSEVIGKKKARSFLLERSHAGNSMIQSLFDFRVLHITTKGYSDRDNPGIRYNIYTLDYGTYVDLIQTTSQPELGLAVDGKDASLDRVVPFSDRRSIRRVVVAPEILEPEAAE